MRQAVSIDSVKQRSVNGTSDRNRAALESKKCIEYHMAGGVLGYDTFAERVVALKPTPWGYEGVWNDEQDFEALTWLQGKQVAADLGTAGKAAVSVARRSPFNRLQDSLQTLRWDGRSRIETWPAAYLGAENTAYSRAVGRCWLISAVARAMEPGCKVDTCLVLEGKQGLGKSSALRILAGDEYYRSTALNLSSLQNVVPQLQGVWIYELAELDSLTLGKHQASEIKQFISNGSDDITQKFEKHVTSFKRKVVFAGTTNKSSYLRDETGARRFWPVVCTDINLQLLAADREQLWAEAYEAWNNEEQWHLSPELEALAREEQEIRYLGDPWLSNIRAWLDPRSAHGKNGVSIQAILGDCLKVPIGKRTQGDMNRVVTCLQTLGWTHHERKRFPGGIREKRYMPAN